MPSMVRTTCSHTYLDFTLVRCHMQCLYPEREFGLYNTDSFGSNPQNMIANNVPARRCHL